MSWLLEIGNDGLLCCDDVTLWTLVKFVLPVVQFVALLWKLLLKERELFGPAFEQTIPKGLFPTGAFS